MTIILVNFCKFLVNKNFNLIVIIVYKSMIKEKLIDLCPFFHNRIVGEQV